MREITIKLNTVKKVQDFVQQIQHVSSTVMITNGISELDAKSVMSVYSFNLLQSLTCRVYGDNEQEEEDVISFIKEWSVA